MSVLSPTPHIDLVHSGAPLRPCRPAAPIHPELGSIGAKRKSRPVAADELGFIPCNINFNSSWTELWKHDGEVVPEKNDKLSTDSEPNPTRAAAREGGVS